MCTTHGLFSWSTENGGGLYLPNSFCEQLWLAGSPTIQATVLAHAMMLLEGHFETRFGIVSSIQNSAHVVRSKKRFPCTNLAINLCKTNADAPSHRAVRAIRHGKPFTVTTYDNTGTGWGGPFQQLFSRGIDLKGDKIAYISRQSGESDTVVVRNLVTGAASMLHGEAREKIKSIVLTSNVVAFVTFEGALYVTKLSDHLLLQKTTRIQLPSSNVQAIAGHDNTLALVLRRGGRGSVFKACVLVYDAETRRLQDYNIDKQPEGKDKMVNAVGIIVDSGRETINIFMLASEPAPLSTGADPAGDDLILTHLRMSLTGVVLSRQGRAWHHNIAREYLKLGVRFGMPPPQLSGCKDEYRIQIAQLPAGVNRSHQPVRLTLDLAFNVKTGSWTVRDQVRRCCRVSEVNRSVSEEDTYDKVLQAEWKGVTMSPGLARHSDLVHSVAMMNDSFLVSMSVESTEQVSGMTSIEVFCFDENVKMYAAQDLGLWPWLDDSRRL